MLGSSASPGRHQCTFLPPGYKPHRAHPACLQSGETSHSTQPMASGTMMSNSKPCKTLHMKVGAWARSRGGCPEHSLWALLGCPIHCQSPGAFLTSSQLRCCQVPCAPPSRMDEPGMLQKLHLLLDAVTPSYGYKAVG